ncbi:NRX4-like protein [Mya arenaria]|uniref:NRX4-like protein n=1 Tax=Mya arenaria TaxID=6604 RepID=A0ABY7EDV8_MYAAR|nr:NRX4-like protein [Mya arenaria]
MARLKIFSCLLIFIFINIDVSHSARNRSPFQYQECRLDRSLGVGKDSISQSAPTVPDSALWGSSFTTDRRMPHMARLEDPTGAWTASVQNSQQFLGVDLGSEYIVTQVYTQGRQGSDEFVTEFTLEFSMDNKTWAEYTNELGLPEIFPGNSDGNAVKKNSLMFPVIARYVKFSPQRWNQFISMRIDVLEAVKVASNGYITYSLMNVATRTESDLIIMRFRTINPEGVLLYADGNQGDYIALQLKRGYLHFTIDLGSTPQVSGETSIVGASMLDDGRWHDLIITRNRTTCVLIVDRLESRFEAQGLFYRLDLDKMIYLGGVDTFNKKGLSTRYNFDGCIDFVRFNGIAMLKDALAQGQIPGRFQTVGPVSAGCAIRPDVPITFTSLESYISVSGAASTGGTVRLDRDGFVHYNVKTSDKDVAVEDVVRNIDIESPTQSFTDGLWHTFEIYIDTEKVNVTVDRNVKVSTRTMNIIPGTDFFIGGSQLHAGFRGCMRNIAVANQPIDFTNQLAVQLKLETNLVTMGSCSITDRCTPNPCEHNGFCTQDWNNFYCNCENTAQFQLSCEMHSQYTIMDGQEEVTIDPDGSGPIEPFKVICNGKTGSSVPVETWIRHDSMGLITVNGFQAPDYYVRKINYDTGLMGLTEVIERAVSCKQEITYKCNNSKLMGTLESGTVDQFGFQKTYGYWVGRTFQDMHYWGGSAPGTYKCECGLTEEGCNDNSKSCNCDSLKDTSDSGLLLHKDYLPVLELHFGDTGSLTDTKIGQHELKELKCAGDNMLDNVITFRKKDATLEFPTFEGDKAGDIWFQFKTTAPDGIMIHDTGETENDFIQIRMINGDTVQFRYNVGNGIQVIEYKTINGLANDIWHTVHVERNRKQTWLRVDNFPEVVHNEQQDEITRLLELTKPLTVGAAVDHRDGYVGCMRGLRVNGVLMDMRGKITRGEETYGVHEGCVGKCASNPCFNHGTCQEGYDHYTCDCAYTPFRGWMCFREVGVNLQPNYKIKYTFDELQGLSSSDFLYIRVGFITKKKQGILIQLRNEANTEYISLEINNNGGIKFFLSVGFQPWELNTLNNNIDLTNGQAHEVIIRRENGGKDVYLQVDNYEPVTKKLGEDISDTILDNPKYLFIGNNDTANTAKGFEGCIYRMQIDNIFPLKRAFQDPQPSFIEPEPEDKIREDMCGFEEITRESDPIEVRPYGPTYVNLTLPPPPQDRSEEKRTIVGVTVAGAFLIFLVILLVFFIYFRQKGDYETKEAKGQENADNPDAAIVFCNTGVPEISKRQEWFM